MASDWSIVSFGECAELVRDTVQPHDCAGMKYIGLEHIEQGTLRLLGVGDGSEITSVKSRFKRGDILFGKLRPYFRKVIRAPFDGVCSTDIWVVRAKPGTDQGFLFYWMASEEFVDTANQGSEGTKMPRAKWDFVCRITKHVPSLSLQRRIAHILGTLDDKIELNRRMNRTLEKMAQAIFKSWFIDFDPVHAKAEGRDPNLPKEIADLFPDSFEDSEIGLIPEGWAAGPLSKIATLTTKTVRPSEWPDRFWEHYSIPAFDEGRYPRWERGDTIKSGKYQVPPSCVLASKLNPQFPRVWLPDVADPMVAICSTEFMPFVPVHEQWRPFLYELLKSPTIQEEICSRATGSTGSRQRVKPKDIAIMSVILPPPEVITAFCTIVDGLHKKMLANQRNSFSLTKTRDTLLPKLLSGEIELDAAEEVV